MSRRAQNWAYELDGLTAPEKSVLNVLCDMADENSLECWPSNAALCRRTALADSTVRFATDVLAELKLIVRWRRKHEDGTPANYQYRVLIGASVPEDADTRRAEMRSSLRKKTASEQGPLRGGGHRKIKHLASGGEHGETAATRRGVPPPRGGGSAATQRRRITTEQPSESPHMQTASTKPSGVFEDSSEKKISQPASTALAACAQIFDEWPEACRKISRKLLQPLIEEWEQDHNRSALDLVQAAKGYLKANSATPTKITWLRQWIEREEWKPYLPKTIGGTEAAMKASETPEDRARWDERFDRAMATNVWWESGESVRESCIAAPAAAWDRAFQRAPDEKSALRLAAQIRRMNRVHYHGYHAVLDYWDAVVYRFQKLRSSGEWNEHENLPDPRRSPREYPSWLIDAYLPKASKSAA